MRAASRILRAEFKHKVPQFEYERSSCGSNTKNLVTQWSGRGNFSLSLQIKENRPFSKGNVREWGFAIIALQWNWNAMYPFVPLVLYPVVKYTWIIVPLYLFNFGRLRTQRFTENSPKGTGSPLKRKKKRFISYRQLGKIPACFSVLLLQGLSRFPSGERKPLSASARFYAFTVKLGEQRPLKVRKWQLPLPLTP